MRASAHSYRSKKISVAIVCLLFDPNTLKKVAPEGLHNPESMFRKCRIEFVRLRSCAYTRSMLGRGSDALLDRA